MRHALITAAALYGTLLCVAAAGVSQSDLQATVGGLTSPYGELAACDLPEDQHLRNVGGSDGAGLCVFTSLDHAGRWHNVPLLIGMRDYMRKHPGGGWPEKVDSYLQRRSKETGHPIPKYVHVRTLDKELLREALRRGFMVCITYYLSPSGRYGGSRIYHMVNLVHAPTDDAQEGWGILDNNYPKTIEWLNGKELARTVALRGDNVWFIVILEPPPPPRLRS
jgi:hypothetical protein